MSETAPALLEDRYYTRYYIISKLRQPLGSGEIRQHHRRRGGMPDVIRRTASIPGSNSRAP
jgi:hypothetical protein